MLLLLLFCFCYLLGLAQSNVITVTGVIRSDSSVLNGVSVYLKTSPEKAVLTNDKGEYSIKVPADGTLVFSYVGYKPQEIPILGKEKINITLESASSELDEVAIVAYGKQKKSSMVGAITTIGAKEITGPTSNLTTMLAGRVAGLIAFQRSGEPGQDNANFFIRGITTFGTGKVDPLILIDGMESSATDLARLQPDDIADFSILKDATAAALYGARGANGVILVSTKLGKEGPAKFSMRAENSISSNTQNFKTADNITYMKLADEAVTTRTPLSPLPYSEEKIAQTEAGADPYLYPNNDWMKMLIKNYTINQRYDVNLSGGGKVAQYYISGTYNIDNGILNVNKLNNFNSNIKLRNYEIRSNININVTKSTILTVKTSGQFDDYSGPVGGGANIFNQVLQANAVMFPAIYPSSFSPNLKHPLFGNAFFGTSLYANPYANEVSGYQQYNSSTLIAQLQLQQKLDAITPGLEARIMAYTDRYAYFDLSRAYSPFYYSLTYNANTGNPILSPLNTNGTEYLNYSPGSKVLNSTTYAEGAISYNHKFGKNEISGRTIITLRNYLDANAGDLQSSLAYRNEGVSGGYSYIYDSRYIAEFDFGYNGSERFAANHRFGFFPSAGVSWNVHNEKFFEPLLDVVNKLKFRATYGLVGNDQIGSASDRFFYLSNVNLDDNNKSVTFGENYGYSTNGVSVSRYANDNITWEKAYKTNIGLDATLFKSLDLSVDIYKEKRKNILMDRSYIPSTMGLTAAVRANVGEAESKGMDIDLTYNKTISKSVWLQGRGTFTFATSKLLVNEEPDYPGEPWRSHVGYSLSQQWGLIAERLFVDDNEVANSPVQNYGEVRGGDLKYRDINGDGEIESADNVPIGYPTTPEITFGYGFSLGIKQWDFSAFFEGNTRVSFFIDPTSIQPFQVVGITGGVTQSGLLSAIAKDHWSEDNRNIYAFWPRLSNYIVQNNDWTSTWWMRNGSFMRLKTAEIGYTFSPKLLKKMHFSSARIYLNGSNLFVLSSFKLWDPEMGGNGLGYPLQKVYNIGINFGF